MKLGKLIKAYHYHNELTSEQVAEEIGISQATVSRIENGKPVMSDTLGALLQWMLEEEPVVLKNPPVRY